MRRRVRALVTVAALTLSALVIGGPSAIAQPTRPASDIIFPFGTHFFPKPQPPPLEPLLRFYMFEHTYTTPRAYRGLICLHKFRVAGSKSRRVFKCAHVNLSNLAAPGKGITWKIGDQPWPLWNCSRGRFFVSFSQHAISSTGQVNDIIQYSPYHGEHLAGEIAWGKLPPDRPEAHLQRNCKKVPGT